MTVTLVCGPPAAGKSTYVVERAKPGDLIVDWDDILAALSGSPKYVRHDDLILYANVARKAVERVLLKRTQAQRSPVVGIHGGVPNAWLIRSAPSRKERADFRVGYGANIVILETSEAECVRRIRADVARAAIAEAQVDAVAQWWFDYVPDVDADDAVVVRCD